MLIPRYYLFAAAILFINVSTQAISATPTALVTETVNPSIYNAIAKTVDARIAKSGVGTPIASATKMTNVRLLLGRTIGQQKSLDNLVKAQQDPKSFSYHHWLTPQELGQQYGMSDSDLSQVTSWLKNNHLSVDSIASNRTELKISGSASDMQNAFHTQLRSFQVNGQAIIGNTNNISVPRALSTAIRGIKGLTTLPVQKLMPIRSVHSDAVINGGATLFWGPNDIATEYNFNDAYTRGLDGTGVKVAIVGQSTIDASIVKKYLSVFGITAKSNLSIVAVPGIDPGNSRGNDGEAYLDSEMVQALAPGASATLYIANDADAAAAYVINNNLAGIINISFDNQEVEGNGFYYNQLFQVAAAEGITVTVSTGDAGPVGLDRTLTTPTIGTHGLSVNALATSPYVTAVGGTSINLDWSTNPPLLAYSNNSNNGNILSYVQENTWNSSCVGSAWLQSANYLTYCNSNPSQAYFILGSSGGLSSCYTFNPDGTCQAGIPAPDYQTNNPVKGLGSSANTQPGVGSGIGPWTTRSIPDIAFIAQYVMVCTYSEPDCRVGANTNNSSYVTYDGTSISAPVAAAMVALIDQSQISKTNPEGRMGSINPLLYQIAQTEYGSNSSEQYSAYRCNSYSIQLKQYPQYSCIFHDITEGTNSMPCLVSAWQPAPNGASIGATCFTDQASDIIGVTTVNGQSAFGAGAGYDLASGLGTPDVGNLIQAIQQLSAPLGLTAQILGDGSVELSWANVSQVNFYQVYQSTTAGNAYQTPPVAQVTGNSVVLNGLTAAQTYFFTITGTSVLGTSPFASEVSVTFPIQAPSVIATSSRSAEVTLTWNSVPYATSYSVYQSDTPNGEASAATLSDIRGLTATIGNLTPGKQYYFKLTANQDSVSSNMSSEVSQTVVANAPTNLSATAGNSMVSLSWAPSAGASTYSVYMGSYSGGEAAKPILTGLSSTTAQVANLNPGSVYFFAVAADNNGGTSTASNEASAVPTAARSGGGKISVIDLLILVSLLLLQRIVVKRPS